MPVTLTIKQVPDDLADHLRRRAAAARRSLQGELLLILEQVRDGIGGTASITGAVREPASPAYIVTPDQPVSRTSIPKSRPPSGKKTSTGKLSLDELWQRARKLGAGTPSESADLIRRDRDARHHR
jgi:plasmid stability protein